MSQIGTRAGRSAPEPLADTASSSRQVVTRHTVSAGIVMPHPHERVYAFLADLENHQHLSDPHLQLHHLSPAHSGGRIVIRGPLGVQRTADTTVTVREAPHEFGGIAVIGRRTLATVRWSIEPAAEGATVVIESVAARTSALDALLLALGGRRWLQRSFERVLIRLAEHLDGNRESPWLEAGGQLNAAISLRAS
jgi:hypothetical protein